MKFRLMKFYETKHMFINLIGEKYDDFDQPPDLSGF